MDQCNERHTKNVQVEPFMSVTGPSTHAVAATEAFQLDEVHRDFQAVCRSFVQTKVLGLVENAEQTGHFPVQLWLELAASGLLGIGYPENLGGSGGGYLALAIFAEELAMASGGIAVTPLVSSYMAAPHLLHFGSPEQQIEYLKPTLEGRKIGAIAVTEPGAGSDVGGISTRARKVNGGYVIDGTKTFITNGGLADFVVLAARTTPDAGHRGITTFLVDKGRQGFEVGRPLRKMGWHSSDTRELIFEGCEVPDSAVLGQVDRGFYQIMRAFQTERLSLSGMGVGLAQAAFDDALKYAQNREAFGHKLSEFQGIRYSLAEMQTDIQAARLLTYQAAGMTDADRDSAAAIAMAKLHSARVANSVADRAVQIFGGYGFLDETRVSMHYRDARVLRIGGGTDETQMEILAKRMSI